jgi:hypothetical protein
LGKKQGILLAKWPGNWTGDETEKIFSSCYVNLLIDIGRRDKKNEIGGFYE